MNKQEAWERLDSLVSRNPTDKDRMALNTLKPEPPVTDDELRAIDKPFGELPRRLQEALVIASVIDREEIEAMRIGLGWCKTSPSFSQNAIYRLAPEPKRMPQPPWHMIDPKYKWFAIDGHANPGVFTEEPRASHVFWETEGNARSIDAILFDRGSVDWTESKVKRPEGE